MNRRRFIGLCLFVCLLLIPAAVHADVGNSFSGGSSGGGYSGGSGLGGMFFFMGGGGGSIAGAIIMMLIIVAWVYFSKNHNAQPRQRSYQGGASIRICNESAAVKAIREIDPQFSAEGFKSFVSEVYLTLQEAWEAKEWRKVRPFESN